MKFFHKLTQAQKIQIFDLFVLLITVPIALYVASCLRHVKWISLFSFLILVNVMYSIFFIVNLAPIREEHAIHKKNYNRYQGFIHLFIAFVFFAICVIINSYQRILFTSIFTISSMIVIGFSYAFLKKTSSLFIVNKN